MIIIIIVVVILLLLLLVNSLLYNLLLLIKWNHPNHYGHLSPDWYKIVVPNTFIRPRLIKKNPQKNKTKLKTKNDWIQILPKFEQEKKENSENHKLIIYYKITCFIMVVLKNSESENSCILRITIL